MRLTRRSPAAARAGSAVSRAQWRRRQSVRPFATGALITAMLLIACSGKAVLAPPPQFDLARLHPFSLDSCGDLAERAGRNSCDPLNLVFPGKSAREVQDSLMAVGWTDNGLGTVQAIVPLGSDVMVTQSVQLFKDDRSALDAPTSRFHVRLWDAPADTTVGAVHHESGFVIHVIDQDWELAETEIREDLCTFATCSVGPLFEEQSRLQGGDEEWRGKRNDARPSVNHAPLASSFELRASSFELRASSFELRAAIMSLSVRFAP